MEQEIDPILEKIYKDGIHSLTDRERKILDEARKRMDG
jgi:predicted DNA binding protein